MGRIKEEDLRLNIIVSGDKSSMKRLQGDLSLTGKTLTELRKHLNLTKKALSNATPGTENWKRLQKEVKTTQARLDELTGKAKKTSSALSGLVKGGAVVAGLRLAARGIVAFTERIADFEQANANLATVLGKSVGEIAALTEQAKELGRTTEYTASQVTSLQTELAKLGFAEPEIMNMTEPVLHFATAVGTDLPQAAQLAGATLRIFGLQSEQTEDTLGVLAVATNKSALNFSYLQNAMSTVGPVANTFGFSVRDTTTLLGALADAGFDASSAATATRNILLNLANSSGKLAKALGEPVHTFPELMEGLKSLSARGIDLSEALELTDRRSVSAFTSFLKGADNAMELREALEDVDGELGRIADERMNTVQGSIKKLQSAWEGFVLAFSNSKGTIKSVIDFITKGINTITDMIGDQAPRLGKALADSMRIELGYDDAQLEEALQAELTKYQGWIATAQSQMDSANKKRRRQLKKNIKDWNQQVRIIQAAIATVSGSGGTSSSGASGSGSSVGSGSTGSSGSGGDSNGESKQSWSLQNDEDFLKAKAALQKKYNTDEKVSKEAFEEELYKLEVEHLTARIASNKEKGAEHAKLEEQLQGKIYDHKVKAQERDKKLKEEAEALLRSFETDETKIAENAENLRYDNEKKSFDKVKSFLEDAAAVEAEIEKKHQANLTKIQLEGQSRRLTALKNDLQIKEAKIRAAYANNSSSNPSGGWNDARLKEDMERKINQERFKSLTAQAALLREMIDTGTAEGANISEKELQELKLKLQQTLQQAAEVNKAITGQGLGAFKGSGGSLFGVSEEQWSLLFKHLKEGKLQASDMMSILGSAGEVASEGFDIASKAIQLTAKKEKKAYDEWVKQNDDEKNRLEKRLNAGLMTQAQYDAKMEQMQAEQDAKQADMELKQAQREKTLAITKSIIDTALATLKTFVQFGGWPAGIVPATIMGTIGAAQTALIAAQPVGYASGGKVVRRQDGRQFDASLDPDKRGYVSSPTVLVGEEGGEYVVPSSGLQNPTLAPILQTIEAARRAGTLRSLDFRAIYPPSASIAGRAEGGYMISTDTNGTSSSRSEVENYTAKALTAAVLRLNTILDRGIKAYVSLLGKGGLLEAEKKYSDIHSRKLK